VKHEVPESRLKKLELSFRRWFNKSYSSSVPVQLVDTPTDVFDLPSDARILFLRQDRIGDVLLSTPVVRAVRKRYPNATIDVVLSVNNVSVQHTLAPFTNNRFVYRKTLGSLLELIARLRRRKYHVVVDLLDNASSTSSILVSRCGAKESVGIVKENAGVYSVCVPLLDKKTVHISDRIAMLLLPFGIDPSTVDMRPFYEISPTDALHAQQTLGIQRELGRKRFGINISGSTEARSLSVEQVSDVIDHLTNHYTQTDVYVFASPRQSDRLKNINERSPSATVVQPNTSFHEYACALHEMDALLSPDTSSVHLAAAWNMPTCVLFNLIDSEQIPWYPYKTHCEAVINDGVDLKSISSAEIIQAVDRLLAYCGIHST